MDEAIMQMVAITDTTPDRAAQYLQVADGDVEQAVSLFFESGGVDLGAAVPSAATASTRGGVSNPIDLDDDHVSDDNDTEITGFSRRTNRPTAQAEDDEAMARRLQDEMYGGAGARDENHPIRAPIARHAETLAGPDSSDYYSGGSLNDAIQERMQAFQSRRGARAPGIFNQQPTSRIWQEGAGSREVLAESTGGASEANARAGYLARLFAPNWELMYTGDWEEARQEGKDEKKWLLVNIQNEKVFDCQVLNRDIWKNESIIETVKENFLFLQYSKDDPRAETYCNYYFQNAQIEDEYPHVAVVDPRTGEQVKLWSKKVPQQAEFLMQLHEFLDRYSLETSARNPVAKRRSEAKKEKPVEQLTEDEQIERAMQASLGGRKESIKVPDEDPDDLTKSIPDLRNSSVDDKDMTDVSEEETSSSSQTSPFASIPSDQPHKEPEMSSSVTRIQLRHPAGRIVRRFAISDPVQRIYEYLKAEPIEGKEGADFELRSLGKDLIDSRDSTIEEAGLKNASVMVEFVDT